MSGESIKQYGEYGRKNVFGEEDFDLSSELFVQSSMRYPGAVQYSSNSVSLEFRREFKGGGKE